MSVVVLVLLAGFWAAILAPALRHGRQHRSPVASVDGFERSMGILASDRFGTPRAPGRHVMVVHDPDRLAGRRARTAARRRRRQVLQGLVGVAALAASGALLVGGLFVGVFFTTVVVLGAYVLLLVSVRPTAHRGRQVTRLDTADAPRARPVSASRIADRIA